MAEDDDLLLDDEEGISQEDLDQDPDLALLLDDETTEGDQEGKEKPPVQPAAPVLDEETVSYIKKLRERDAAPPSQPAPPPPPVEQPKPFDVEAFASEIETDILSGKTKDGVKKLIGLVGNVAKTVREQTLREVSQHVAPALSGNVELHIQRAISRFEGNPVMDDEVREELDRIVDRTRKMAGDRLSALSPQQIKEGIDAAFAEAVGNVTLRRATKGRQSAPPPKYSGGGRNIRPTNRTSKRLSDDERGFIRNLRAAGLNDNDIKAALKEYRAEKAS